MRLIILRLILLQLISFLKLGTFVLKYEYEYENDFSNLVRVLKITCQADLVPRTSASFSQRQEGARALGARCFENSYSFSYSYFGLKALGLSLIWYR